MNEYNINWSNDAVKPPFIVYPRTHITEQCSLNLYGKGAPRYGEGIQENLIRMLEHFCSDVPPAHPTRGQIWYDTTVDSIKLYTGAIWAQVSGGNNSMSPVDILNALITVDGDNSGLDADTLDGQHGSFYARVDSPALTGTPTAPTASLGTVNNQLATTQYVVAAVGGLLQKPLAGNVDISLTGLESGNAILEFTGALTANVNVVIPSTPTRSWIVRNKTTGNFVLMAKTATGAGTALTQNSVTVIYSDGTDIINAASSASNIDGGAY